MKDRKKVRGLLWSAIMLVLVVVGSASLIVYSVGESRRRGANEYRMALDSHLEAVNGGSLSEIRAGLRKWIESYGELNVAASFTNVYMKVDAALAEADALNERLPTMTAQAFKGDLESLRTKVSLIPAIGIQAYEERYPFNSEISLLGKVLGGSCLIVGVIFILVEREERIARTKSAASSL